MLAHDGYLLNHGKHPRLCVIVPICSNSQVHFVLEGVFSVSRHQTEKWIFRRQGHDAIVKYGRVAPFHDLVLNGGQSYIGL